jgi:hypothetical protein
VKFHGFCVTLPHSLDKDPLLLGGLHSRSRLTDQKVYRPSPLLSAKFSTVWKSL